MAFIEEMIDDILHISFKGHLNSDIAPELKRFITEIVEYRKINKLIVDLKNITTTNSTGVGTLIWGYIF